MNQQIRTAELLQLHRALVEIASSANDEGVSLLAVHAGYIRRELSSRTESAQEALDKLAETHAEKGANGRPIVVEINGGQGVKIADVDAFRNAQVPVLAELVELPAFRPLDWPSIEKCKAKLTAPMIDALLAANLLAGLPSFNEEPAAEPTDTPKEATNAAS